VAITAVESPLGGRFRGEGRRREDGGRAATTGVSTAITATSSTMGAPVDDSLSSPISTGGAAVVGRPNREVVMDTIGPADELRGTPAKVDGRRAPIPMLGRSDALIDGGETVPL